MSEIGNSWKAAQLVGNRGYIELGPETHKRWVKVMKIAGICFAIALIILLIVAVTTHVDPPPKKSPIHFPAMTSVLEGYSFEAVAADSSVCSTVGKQVIEQQGGSVVDGAIAATICTGVLNMQAAGVGGGFFMTVWDAKAQRAVVINARETAPLSSYETMFLGNPKASVDGPLAIATPGEIAGYWKAHQMFGKTSWKALFEPTIKICNETGFVISQRYRNGMDEILARIKADPDSRPFSELL